MKVLHFWGQNKLFKFHFSRKKRIQYIGVRCSAFGVYVGRVYVVRRSTYTLQSKAFELVGACIAFLPFPLISFLLFPQMVAWYACVFLFLLASFNCWEFMITIKITIKLFEWQSEIHQICIPLEPLSIFITFNRVSLSTAIANLHFLTQCALWFVCIEDASSICYAAQAAAAAAAPLLHTIQTLKFSLLSITTHSFAILKFSRSSIAFPMNCMCVCGFHIFMGVHNIGQDYHAAAYAMAYCLWLFFFESNNRKRFSFCNKNIKTKRVNIEQINRKRISQWEQ